MTKLGLFGWKKCLSYSTFIAIRISSASSVTIFIYETTCLAKGKSDHARGQSVSRRPLPSPLPTLRCQAAMGAVTFML
jgi:hypothetical protein